jgi:hypothetical protein
MKKTEIIERLNDIKESIGNFSDSTIISFIDELIEEL